VAVNQESTCFNKVKTANFEGLLLEVKFKYNL